MASGLRRTGRRVVHAAVVTAFTAEVAVKVRFLPR